MGRFCKEIAGSTALRTDVLGAGHNEKYLLFHDLAFID
jgi:hypothetical protein